MLYVLGVDDLTVQEELRQCLEAFGMLTEELLSTLIFDTDDLPSLFVDELGGAIAVGLRQAVAITLHVVVVDVGELVAHTVVGDHSIGRLRGVLEVVGCTRRDATEEDLFGGTTCERGAHLVTQSLGRGDLTLLGEVPSRTEGLASRYDGDLDQRIGVLEEPADRGVSSFVEGDAVTLLFGGHLILLLQTTDDAVDGVHKVITGDELLASAGSDEGCLITYIGDVSTREAWGTSCQEVDVDRFVDLQRAKVHEEDLLTVVDVGKVYIDLTVEAACTQEGGVEDVGAVRSSQHDDPAIGAEAVHFGEELVQRILTLVVAPEVVVATTGTTHRIDFVDEDDTGSLLLGGLEEVTDT